MKGLSILLVVGVAVTSCLGYVEHPGSRYAPTRGAIWPEPQQQVVFPESLAMKPGQFAFKVTGTQCTLLELALLRYREVLGRLGGRRLRSSRRRPQARTHSSHPQGSQVLTELAVKLTGECQDWPAISMLEEYFLEVSSPKVAFGTAELKSDSIWGILRGLESFSQLISLDKQTGNLMINSTSIHDFPRFTHRGLLLDTSRHFVSVPVIQQLLDGMEINKLNVFHWHIVDDQSFPFESRTFPKLSGQGAFHPKLVYHPDDVKRVIEYARIRGIRVMSEFDTPGHTRSWGVAYPQLLTQCYDPKTNLPNGDLGPMDLSNEGIYDFMENLLKEIVQVFPDKYVHLGGDEVDFDCWMSNPNVTSYMTSKNITTYSQLEEVYIQRIVDMVSDLSFNSVVWQEVFVNGVNLPNGTVVHVWTGNQERLLNEITKEGLPALLSTCWYLDHLTSGGDWQKFYKCDPHDFPGSDAQKQLVLGGEACMWGEVIDDNNVVSRIFPRASATAEKLWSAQSVNDYNKAIYRMEEHYCRMNKRGVRAQPPSGPGFCI